MPASITIALVASWPKLIGSRIEIPARGPLPGSTPTSVPTRQPRNGYHSTAGCSATEKPSQRLSNETPIIFSLSRRRLWLRHAENRFPLFPSLVESQHAGFERRLQRGAEHPPGHHREADAIGRGAQDVLALHHHEQ